MSMIKLGKYMLYDCEGFVRIGVLLARRWLRKNHGEVLEDMEQVLLRISMLYLATGNGRGDVVRIIEIALP